MIRSACELARRLAGRVRTIGYSLSPRDVPVDEAIVAGRRVDPASLPVLGRFNVANALGVLGCLVARGFPWRRREAARKLPPVPGRMQAVGEEPLVVIDYAHTPDALENVLQALRPVAAARAGASRWCSAPAATATRASVARWARSLRAFADRMLITSTTRAANPLAIIERHPESNPGARGGSRPAPPSKRPLWNRVRRT